MSKASSAKWLARSCNARDAASSSPIWGTEGSAGLRRDRPRPDSEVPADRAEINRSRRAVWEAYNSVLETGRSLSIPIMTQEVFLNFLGYGDRYAGR